MSYGDVEGVRARAGVLAPAFAEGQPVPPSSLEQFLDDSAAILDVGLAAHGVDVPVSDQTAQAALAAINDDLALLLAIDAAFPGSSARDDVADLRNQIQARVDAYNNALTAGNLPLVLYLGALQTGAQGEETGAGASNFWTKDALTYEWWARFVSTRWGYWPDPWGVPYMESPPFTKGQPL